MLSYVHLGMRPASEELCSSRLSTCGFRFTPQRQCVYAVLLDERDHPTAEEVFIRSKQLMPDISLATVYNCLEALVRSGLARQLTLDRGAARFCPNMQEHCHFYCDSCGNVFDIALPALADLGLPEGCNAQRVDMTVHGRCASCVNEVPKAAGNRNTH